MLWNLGDHAQAVARPTTNVGSNRERAPVISQMEIDDTVARLVGRFSVAENPLK
jgi:hypothetical protein